MGRQLQSGGRVGVLVVVGMLWAAIGNAFAFGEAIGGEQFVLPKGPLGVTRTDLTLRDKTREKDLEVRVRVPVATAAKPMPAAGWPVVVFSHGAGGSRDAFPDLLDECASHGFASIAMTHADSIQLRRRQGEKNAPRELFTEEGRAQLRRSVDLGERVADCSFVLDQLAELPATLAKAGGKTAVKFDADRVAIAGHSAGAFTTQLAAGVKAVGLGVGKRGMDLVSIADDRFKAAIVISGQGTASRILKESSWSEVAVPMLVITGSQDTSPSGMGSENPETRQHPYTHSRGRSAGGPPAYLLFIEGATHSAYSGKAASNLLREQPETDAELVGSSVTTTTVAFLKAYVLGESDAKKLVDSDKLADTIPGRVRYEHK